MPTHENATIVVGFDGSPASRAAVEHAVGRVPAGGRLVVVSAYEVPADHIGTPYYQDMLDVTVRKAEQDLRALEAECPGLASVAYEADLVPGHGAGAILAAAEAREAGEIVVGTRGHGRLRSLVLGSVAQAVIHDAACPVLVIPERMVTASAA